MANSIHQVSPLCEISQTDLEFIVGLESIIQATIQLKNKKVAIIMARVLAGHPIEEGPHTAVVTETTDGAVRTIQLIVR